MSNHLHRETSPYLLQHVDNPVDWYPWGQEALQRAQAENKPILLSIGYAACHWCHVMAHESFEDAETARLMNQCFINIKVDREERPDIDSIYMSAVTSMTGHGGWPMTVFLTPEAKPFYCGTYFPPEPRFGMPSFSQVLGAVAGAWKDRPDEVHRSAENVTQHLHQGQPGAGAASLDTGLLLRARKGLRTQFDAEWGGFGSAPKFPQPMVLDFLLRDCARDEDSDAQDMVTVTLQRMAEGGIYDHLGGGFARYSTDRQWLVPHFEKMLYDNGQLARLYLRAYQATGNDRFRCVAEETLDYLLREMRHPEGGFFSSQDADSEGEEGKFFVWNADEIRAALGKHAGLFMRVYGICDEGNWEGRNVLHLACDPGVAAGEFGIDAAEAGEILARSRAGLFTLRAQRVWPGLDDKVLTAWNGLALGALAEAGRVLARGDYLDAAVQNAEFLRATVRRPDGRLFRTWKQGSPARLNAYLEDYACLAEALLSLYEANFETRWYAWAVELVQIMLRHFRLPGHPGFYDTSDDHEQLIQRPRAVQDNAMPSGGSRAAMAIFRVGLYSGDSEMLRVAEEAVTQQLELMGRYPAGFGEWLNLASFMLGNPRELALAGPVEALGKLRDVVNERYRPDLVVAAGFGDDSNAPPLLTGRPMVAGKPSAYLCRRFTCEAPVTEPGELRSLLSTRD